MLQKMFAHAQYCSSGDQTLNACMAAIEEVGAAPADEHLTVVVSDANLQRYGITSEDLSSALLGDHTRCEFRPLARGLRVCCS